MSDSPYADIIDLPHHVSEARSHMTPLERAAQFAPFAALTGYDAAIAESARLTDEKTALGDWAMAELNDKINFLQACAQDHPLLTVTYFLPDEKKTGGEYVTVSGKLKKLRLFERELLLSGQSPIPLDDIQALRGEVFAEINE